VFAVISLFFILAKYTNTLNNNNNNFAIRHQSKAVTCEAMTTKNKHDLLSLLENCGFTAIDRQISK
jgi:hypothetical protein